MYGCKKWASHDIDVAQCLEKETLQSCLGDQIPAFLFLSGNKCVGHCKTKRTTTTKNPKNTRKAFLLNSWTFWLCETYPQKI